MEYDFIIVGSGSVGAAAGYYATQAGLRVLMIDSAHPPHKQGSHHGDTRLIRHAYGEGEYYVPLVLRAQQLWGELQAHCNEPIFDKTGVLNLGPQDSAFLAGVRNSASRWDLPLEPLTASQLRQRWPQISVPDNYLGLFEPNAGVLYSEKAISTWITLAREAGCSQLFNCPVTAIEALDDGAVVTTPEGEFTGHKLLLSAGTWVKTLAPTLPVTPVRKVFAWFQADGRYATSNRFPAFTGELPNGDQFYGFPAENDTLKIGKHNGGQAISHPEQRLPFAQCPGDGSEAFPFLRQILPGIGGCLYGESCTYDNTPDEDFIVDTLPGIPNGMVITGLSGHGFKFASVLGEIASQFAQSQPVAFDLRRFRLDRFASAAAQ
ncbi:N-methyl-L-tryptophan oxidase [Shimwellia pseudoproteus]|uniref:N-methyl-L-tryptophan oxidase n=1 Tax=Shimwellia pseudoproteus TaxID=570012 RepID=UPI0018EB67E1|nr:N-methyl-L-tryptophan oxidase [Shimwellia pseudoproteus]MBJ3815978.1 N-methyl-L-tryptophan oxidase [Shimwellia pseudoproteus]